MFIIRSSIFPQRTIHESEHREDHNLPSNDPIPFLEVEVCDASEFAHVMKVKGMEVGGYRVLRAEGSAVPNAIAAFLLHLRDQTRKIPHAYFHWGSGNPITYLFDYVAFGQGDAAPVTREVLRQAEARRRKAPGDKRRRLLKTCLAMS